MNKDYILPLIVVGVIIGFVIGINFADHFCEKEAIRHNAAHYNTHTGKFEWNQ